MPTISTSRLDFLVDDEAKLIGFMAGVLQISEYEFFRIAYKNWFNRQITEQRLDSLFKDYLATCEAPYWVNDFARKVHVRFEAGELYYKDYGITRRPNTLRNRITGWIIITSLLILMLIYSYLVTKYLSY